MDIPNTTTSLPQTIYPSTSALHSIRISNHTEPSIYTRIVFDYHRFHQRPIITKKDQILSMAFPIIDIPFAKKIIPPTLVPSKRINPSSDSTSRIKKNKIIIAIDPGHGGGRSRWSWKNNHHEKFIHWILLIDLNNY